MPRSINPANRDEAQLMRELMENRQPTEDDIRTCQLCSKLFVPLDIREKPRAICIDCARKIGV